MSNILFLLIGDISHDGRILKEIRSLRGMGHEVTLLCTSCSKNISALNIDVKLVLIPKKSGGGIFGILLHNIPFYIKVWHFIRDSRPDYVHCNDFNTMVVSLLRVKGVKYVYDAHELSFGTSRIIVDAFFKLLEKKLCNIAACIIVAQVDRLKLMQISYSLNPKKCFLLENFPEDIKVPKENLFLSEFGYRKNDGESIILYSGVMDESRCVCELVDAMRFIDTAVLFLVGSMSSELYAKISSTISKYSLQSKVYVKNFIDNSKVLWLASSCDIGICLYRPNRYNTYFSASNKLYELLDCGVKVLSNITPSTLRVCESTNSVLIDEITPASISFGIKRLISMPNPKPANYYWDNQISVLEKIYNQV